MDNLTDIKILIDFKQYRIRLHKASLHKLGDPMAVQFLINPDTKVLAIKAYDYEISGDQTYRINKKRYLDKQSVEIHSRSLVCSLCGINPDLEHNHCYLLYGSIIQAENMAVFHLSNSITIS